MSQSQLAEKMGVSRQQISKIVKGQENFTFETIDKLEKALGVSLMKIELKEPEITKAESVPAGATVFFSGEFTFDPVVREVNRIQLSRNWYIRHPGDPSMVYDPGQAIGIPFWNPHPLIPAISRTHYSIRSTGFCMIDIKPVNSSTKKSAKTEELQSVFNNV